MQNVHLRLQASQLKSKSATNFNTVVDIVDVSGPIVMSDCARHDRWKFYGI